MLPQMYVTVWNTYNVYWHASVARPWELQRFNTLYWWIYWCEDISFIHVSKTCIYFWLKFGKISIEYYVYIYSNLVLLGSYHQVLENSKLITIGTVSASSWCILQAWKSDFYTDFGHSWDFCKSIQKIRVSRGGGSSLEVILGPVTALDPIKSWIWVSHKIITNSIFPISCLFGESRPCQTQKGK